MANNQNIQLTRGTTTAINNATLLDGQPVYDKDKGTLVIGNGGDKKKLNVDGTAKLGTTTGTTTTTNRQPDSIFETNSNTVKNATNVVSKINDKNIADIFESDGTTVKNATTTTYANYASTDTTKGTIEERLTNLGFSEGTVEIDSTSAITVSTNYLKRQGNYVIGELVIVYAEDEYVQDIGVIPDDFKPKNDEIIYIKLIHEGGSNEYGTMAYKISSEDGTIAYQSYNGVVYQTATSPYYTKHTTTTPPTFADGVHLYFGYEASPRTNS